MLDDRKLDILRAIVTWTIRRANSLTSAVLPVPGCPISSACGRRILRRFFSNERNRSPR